jgi:hypothetical protein
MHIAWKCRCNSNNETNSFISYRKNMCIIELGKIVPGISIGSSGLSYRDFNWSGSELDPQFSHENLKSDDAY